MDGTDGGPVRVVVLAVQGVEPLNAHGPTFGKEGTTVSGRYIHRHSVGYGPRAAQLGSRTPSHRRAHVQNLATKDLTDRGIAQAGQLAEALRAAARRYGLRLTAVAKDRQACRPATSADRSRRDWSPGRRQATSIERMTFSEGESQGERAPSRRYTP